MGVRTRIFVRLCDEQRCETETTAPRVLTCMCAHVCMCVCMCVCVCVCVCCVCLCVGQRGHIAQGRIRAITALWQADGANGATKHGASTTTAAPSLRSRVQAGYLRGNATATLEATLRLVSAAATIGWQKPTSVEALPLLAALLHELPRQVLQSKVVPVLSPWLSGTCLQNRLMLQLQPRDAQPDAGRPTADTFLEPSLLHLALTLQGLGVNVSSSPPPASRVAVPEKVRGLLGQESDVKLLERTLLKATWPGNNQRIHPVWTVAADAISRGACTGGGAERDALEDQDVAVVKSVLQALWTRVIVHMSGALQLQVARDLWRRLPAGAAGIALPLPLIRLLTSTLASSASLAARAGKSRRGSEQQGPSGRGDVPGEAGGSAVEGGQDVVGGALLAQTAAAELVLVIQERVEEGRLKPSDCARILKTISYECPDWDSRIKGGARHVRVAGLLAASSNAVSTGVVRALVVQLTPRQLRRHMQRLAGIYVDPWATAAEEALGQDVGRDAGGGAPKRSAQRASADNARQPAASAQDKRRKASLLLPGSPAFEAAEVRRRAALDGLVSLRSALLPSARTPATRSHNATARAAHRDRGAHAHQELLDAHARLVHFDTELLPFLARHAFFKVGDGGEGGDRDGGVWGGSSIGGLASKVVVGLVSDRTRDHAAKKVPSPPLAACTRCLRSCALSVRPVGFASQ